MTPHVTFERGGGERRGVQVEGQQYVQVPCVFENRELSRVRQPRECGMEAGGEIWGDGGASAAPKGTRGAEGRYCLSCSPPCLYFPSDESGGVWSLQPSPWGFMYQQG